MFFYKDEKDGFYVVGDLSVNVPSGCVEITEAEYKAIGQSHTTQPTIKEQIAALECSITPRRVREAILTNDYSFISGVDAQIAALRAQL